MELAEVPPECLCPRHHEPTQELVHCTTCGELGCIERCFEFGKEQPCWVCRFVKYDDFTPGEVPGSFGGHL